MGTHIENLKNYLRITSAKKKQIRKNRMYGLKKLDIVLQNVDIQTIIDEAISLYKKNRNLHYSQLNDYYLKTYGYNDWSYFHYDCFLDVVRKYLESISSKYIETSISFNLDEALTEEQLKYISKKLNLSLDTYDDAFPRDLAKYGRESGFPNAKTNG
jgi:hypothetical protein